MSAGSLKLATLVPGVQEGGFSGRLLFSGTDTAMAYVSVYGAPAAAPLTAQLTVTDSTGADLGTLPTQLLNAPDGSRVIIGGMQAAWQIGRRPNDVVVHFSNWATSQFHSTADVTLRRINAEWIVVEIRLGSVT